MLKILCHLGLLGKESNVVLLRLEFVRRQLDSHLVSLQRVDHKEILTVIVLHWVCDVGRVNLLKKVHHHCGNFRAAEPEPVCFKRGSTAALFAVFAAVLEDSEHAFVVEDRRLRLKLYVSVVVAFQLGRLDSFIERLFAHSRYIVVSHLFESLFIALLRFQFN